MKKVISCIVALAVFISVIFIDSAKAQITLSGVQQHLAAYEDAWNKQSIDALMDSYTSDASVVNTDGTVAEGKTAVQEMYAGIFYSGKSFLLLKNPVVLSETNDAVVVAGKWQLLLKTTEGTDTALSGAYTNTMTLQNGKLKISKTVLSGLIKTIATFKISNWDEWETGFKSVENERKNAGELDYEMGAVADEPNTVYVITEWASAEAARAFFANPIFADLDTLRNFGIMQAPHIMVFAKK